MVVQEGAVSFAVSEDGDEVDDGGGGATIAEEAEVFIFLVGREEVLMSSRAEAGRFRDEAGTEVEGEDEEEDVFIEAAEPELEVVGAEVDWAGTGATGSEGIEAEAEL